MGLLRRARVILRAAPKIGRNGSRVSVVVGPSGGQLAEHEQVIPRSPVSHPTVFTMTLLFGNNTFSQYAMGMN